MPANELTLRPMTPDEVAVYLKTEMTRFAQEVSTELTICPDSARAHVAALLSSKFPGGVPDRTQHPCILQVGTRRIGLLHYALEGDPQRPECFLYNLLIDPEHRRLGWGKAAVQLLEHVAQGAAATHIRLSVWAANAPAVRLDERLGFTARQLTMVKPLR